MPVFNLAQASGGQSVPQMPLPEYAAVDTNFILKAYVENNPTNEAALQMLEANGTVLIIASKTLDEIGHVVARMVENLFKPSGWSNKKVGSYLKTDAYARNSAANEIRDIFGILRKDPFVSMETSLDAMISPLRLPRILRCITAMRKFLLQQYVTA